MLQIKNWENLLLELFPGDNKLQFELYQWREGLLSELTQYQEPGVSQDNLESSIHRFNHAITETVREEKWAARAQLKQQETTCHNRLIKSLIVPEQD